MITINYVNALIELNCLYFFKEHHL